MGNGLMVFGLSGEKIFRPAGGIVFYHSHIEKKRRKLAGAIAGCKNLKNVDNE